MSRMRAMTQLQKDGLTGAILSAGLGVLFCALVIGEGLRNLSYELPFLFRGRLAATNVVVVYMDEPSHRLCRQPFDSPWSRELHGRLVRRVAEWGAKAVVFDVHFGEPGPTNEDAALIEAAAQYGRVIVAAYPTVQASKVGSPVWTRAVPFPALAEVARYGEVEVTWGEDFVRRHYQSRFGEPSLAWRVAELTMSNPPPLVSVNARWVNYYGPPFSLPYYSYWQVVSNAVEEAVAAFSNKVVFVGSHVSIGYPAGRPTEYFRTPYSIWNKKALAPGVEVNATTYLNLLRGDWLTEMPWAAELILTALGGVLLGWGLTRFEPMPAVWVGIGSIVFIGAAANLWVWGTHIWTPWLILAGVQAPSAVVWSVFAHARRWSAAPEQRPVPVCRVEPASAGSASESEEAPTTVSPRSVSPLFSTPPMRAGPAEESVPVIPDHTMVRRIGQGAYGEVWLARDVIGGYHAVKVVHRRSFRGVEPFEREFRGMQRFTPISRSHPGLVNILHVGLNNEAGYFYYIMEIGDDEEKGQQIDPDHYTPKNLAQELRRHGAWPVETCLQLGLDLSAALEHLHRQGLIHRDVKPSNIIFVNNAPKFADVGLVTEVAATGQDVSYVGTEGYLAPEGPGTTAADVYSLGKVLYEVSTGFDRRRFPELPTAMIQGHKSPALTELNRIMLKACEMEPQRRYPSASALHQDLLQLKTAGLPRQPKSRLRRWFVGLVRPGKSTP